MSQITTEQLSEWIAILDGRRDEQISRSGSCVVLDLKEARELIELMTNARSLLYLHDMDPEKLVYEVT